MGATVKKCRKFTELAYICTALLLALQFVPLFSSKASATYAGANGDIIATQNDKISAFDPTTSEVDTLRSFDPHIYSVSGASTNRTGEIIAYLLESNTGNVEFRVYNRQTQSDQLIKAYTFDSTDVNGDYPPNLISPISPDGNYVALTATNVNGESVLQIARTSDGAVIARYTNALGAIDWSSDSAKVFATNEIDGVYSFGWFSTDGSGRDTVIPSSALPALTSSTVPSESVATSLSPDGQHVMYTTTGADFTQLREISISASDDHLLVGNTSSASFPLYGVYSPDGQRFAYELYSFDEESGVTSATFITQPLDGDVSTITTSPPEEAASNIIWIPAAPADTTPPVVTGEPDRSSNANGWYNSEVNIDWQATDPTPSSGTPTIPPNTIASQEGKNVTYTSSQSCDPAGNCATGTIKLSIDKTPPAGSFTGSNLVLRLLGGNITGATNDNLSGVDEVTLSTGNLSLSSKTDGITLACNNDKTSCAWTATNTSSLPLGLNTYTLAVTDAAGNTFSTTRTYLVI